MHLPRRPFHIDISRQPAPVHSITGRLGTIGRLDPPDPARFLPLMTLAAWTHIRLIINRQRPRPVRVSPARASLRSTAVYHLSALLPMTN